MSGLLKTLKLGPATPAVNTADPLSRAHGRLLEQLAEQQELARATLEGTIWVNQGRPRALLIALGQANYEPVLQAPFQAAVAEAVNNVPELMAAELADAVAYLARQRGGQS